MSKNIASHNVNQIFKDVIHIGRDINDVYPKEGLYDGIGERSGISFYNRNKKTDVSAARGNFTLPIVSNKSFRGYNAGDVKPEFLEPLRWNRSNIFLDLDKYSAFYINIPEPTSNASFTEEQSINAFKIRANIFTDYMDLAPDGYEIPIGFFDHSVSPTVLKVGSLGEYQSALIIPYDVVDTEKYSELYPNPKWSLAVRKKPLKKIDPRLSTKTFKLIIKNSSSHNMNNRSMISFYKSNPIDSTFINQLFTYFLPLHIRPCDDNECDDRANWDPVAWKIDANTTAIYEIFIPEPTFYMPFYMTSWDPSLTPSYEEYVALHGIDPPYFFRASSRIAVRKLF